MKLLYKIPLLLCLLIAGCSSGQKGKVLSKNINEHKIPVLSTVDHQRMVAASNIFTLNMFGNLIGKNSSHANLFVSPLSVGIALGLAGNGSAKQTLDAFKYTLNFAGHTQDQVNGYYNNVITHLLHLDPNTTIDIANSIWFEQGFSVQPKFLQTDSSIFHAKIQSLDFSSPAAINTINKWINNQTGGKIPSIVSTIPATAVMYLVNAIYFKSGWNEKFDASQTKKMPFFLGDNRREQVSFMTGDVDFNHYKDDKAEVIELPYTNSKFSMVIVMPVPGGGMSPSDLNLRQLEIWEGNLDPRDNTIKMPKFKFSYNIDLKNTLTDLGMGDAFTDTANFSLVSPDVHLKITEVMHKAFIETDESGSTAAAATSVREGLATALPPQKPIVIDHPFLFLIMEKDNGLIVFAGMVNDPLLTGN